MLVLDEADEMLNKGKELRSDCSVTVHKVWLDTFTLCNCFIIYFCLFPLGFKEQIYDVYRYLPPATQVSCECVP